MKTKSKALLLALCAVLLVAASVLGTMAYLTSQDEVTNTFTVGSVSITLDEAKVNTDGTYVTDKDNRTDTNDYHLLPGHSYIKDPTIHVGAKSEDCWLFVQITDEIAAIQDADTIAAQLAENGWTLVSGTTNVYAHEDIANAGDDVVVFKSFKIKGDIENTALTAYAGETIKVIAYAVQADGFDTAAAAWTAAFAQN